MKPRVIRALKGRPRLIDMGMREELLEEVEKNMEERRTPEVVAHRISHNVSSTLQQAGEPVVRNRVANMLGLANDTVIDEL